MLLEDEVTTECDYTQHSESLPQWITSGILFIVLIDYRRYVVAIYG